MTEEIRLIHLKGLADVSGAHFCGQSCDSSGQYVVIERFRFIVIAGSYVRDEDIKYFGSQQSRGYFF